MTRKASRSRGDPIARALCGFAPRAPAAAADRHVTDKAFFDELAGEP
jgi:hypothetical protein